MIFFKPTVKSNKCKMEKYYPFEKESFRRDAITNTCVCTGSMKHINN